MKVKHVLEIDPERCCLLAAAVAAAPCDKLRGHMLFSSCAQRVCAGRCETPQRPPAAHHEGDLKYKRKVPNRLQLTDVGPSVHPQSSPVLTMVALDASFPS